MVVFLDGFVGFEEGVEDVIHRSARADAFEAGTDLPPRARDRVAVEALKLRAPEDRLAARGVPLARNRREKGGFFVGCPGRRGFAETAGLADRVDELGHVLTGGCRRAEREFG